MNFSIIYKFFLFAFFLLFSFFGYASGMWPESSVVIVNESDGEGVINLKNTDKFPLLMITRLQESENDKGNLLIITPPVARVEPGQTQSVRFILKNKTPIKKEILRRVTFEGIPPQEKNKNEVRVSIRQNLPVIIRPAGLAYSNSPWDKLVWAFKDDKLSVHNPSPYVVRLGQYVKTLPDNEEWSLPRGYILPDEQLILARENKKTKVKAVVDKVRISPATTWGFTVNDYDAVVTR